MAKRVLITYFKPTGKYYTKEVVEISEDLNGYDALFKELPKHHRIKSMYMHVQNGEMFDDYGEVIGGETIPEIKEPYIVPHLFPPKESGM